MEHSRPSFIDIYMQMAKLVAQRSTCHRLKVGTVITSTDYRKVLSIGYNGNASGLRNGCDSTQPGACGCLHSEENAIINCDTPRDVTKIVFVTHLPCMMCAKRLINLGNVHRVVYETPYRITDSIDVLRKSNISVCRLWEVDGVRYFDSGAETKQLSFPWAIDEAGQQDATEAVLADS